MDGTNIERKSLELTYFSGLLAKARANMTIQG